MPTSSIVSYRKTRKKPSCDTIARLAPSGEKQNSLMLQLSLAHEYELELLLIVDDDELDEDDELLPFIVVQLMPNDHL
jgi:hypothetical protein